jgi:hypothetical protein
MVQTAILTCSFYCQDITNALNDTDRVTRSTQIATDTTNFVVGDVVADLAMLNVVA